MLGLVKAGQVTNDSSSSDLLECPITWQGFGGVAPRSHGNTCRAVVTMATRVVTMTTRVVTMTTRGDVRRACCHGDVTYCHGDVGMCHVTKILCSDWLLCIT